MKEWERAWEKWDDDLGGARIDGVGFKAGWDAAVKSSAELLRENYGHSKDDVHREVLTAYRQIKALLAEEK